MHPLHDYLARQLAEKLKSRRVLVWYDPRREFGPFVDELRGAQRTRGAVAAVALAGSAAKLIEHDGSFFELRALAEPLTEADEPELLLLYVPGVRPDPRGSVLLELEKAGATYDRPLKWVARQVLRKRYTDGVIDEMLAPERVSYEDLARAASDTSAAEPPSLLKGIFHDASGNEALLARWLVQDDRDADIEAKEATRELIKLVRSWLGLELPPEAALPKLRSVTLRYVLGNEFRADLRCPAPATLDALPAPATEQEQQAVRELARRLRAAFADGYAVLADRVEAELGLRHARIAAESLGAIDTFRFEERALLAHCGELIASRRFAEALALVGEREHSFWLDRDVARKAQWEACRRMAELGAIALTVDQAVARAGVDPGAWLAAYTASDGWYRLDQAQRRLEAWVTTLDEEPSEKPLGIVRRAYEDCCHRMAEGFTEALARAHWTVSGALHQTSIYSDVVAGRPRPVAYFLVDAMRFEMGVELAERLPKGAEIGVRPALAALPSITPIGMAALQPGASKSFSVVAQGGRLGARIDDAFLPDVAARKKFTAARVPKLVDLTLDEVLSLQPSKLAKKVGDAQVLVVRSQEIDHAGETGFTFQARQVMDTVIDNLARAIRKLSNAGVEHAVVAADHGHLFFPVDRDESMRTDAPGGAAVELHRRCWVGRGGATPTGCVRVTAAALGYDSDLELVFPTGSGVFKAGGDLAFHHGGPSLQELVVPVLTVRLKRRESSRPPAGQGPVTVTGLPDAITNRIFTVQLSQPPGLFAGPMMVRPVLMYSGRQVGAVGMAIEADLDKATGCVTLMPGKVVTVAFKLGDERAPSLRVVVQDPATDADLCPSLPDIPVRLGV